MNIYYTLLPRSCRQWYTPWISQPSSTLVPFFMNHSVHLRKNALCLNSTWSYDALLDVRKNSLTLGQTVVQVQVARVLVIVVRDEVLVAAGGGGGDGEAGAARLQTHLSLSARGHPCVWRRLLPCWVGLSVRDVDADADAAQGVGGRGIVQGVPELRPHHRAAEKTLIYTSENNICALQGGIYFPPNFRGFLTVLDFFVQRETLKKLCCIFQEMNAAKAEWDNKK